jgi:hypothetical protein
VFFHGIAPRFPIDFDESEVTKERAFHSWFARQRQTWNLDYKRPLAITGWMFDAGSEIDF